MDIDLFKSDIQKCLEHIKDELSQIRTGRATPELVEGIMVNAYESMSPIKNFATINAIDPKTIVINPWDKGIVDNIVKGITSANMGFSAMKEGDRILVKIPDLTEERRKEYVKVMAEKIENGRIAVRQIRQKYMQELDELQKSGSSEDEIKRARDEIEKIVKESNEEIENIRDTKEKELLTI
jgi:ribosome recycling factor